MYYIGSMTTTTTNSLGHFSLKLLLHSSNSLTIARMEVKLKCRHQKHSGPTQSPRYKVVIVYAIILEVLLMSTCIPHAPKL